ncbi:response regulator transcription factor [bacterium]|nr:response regulator transcription factor [bacterium]
MPKFVSEFWLRRKERRELRFIGNYTSAYLEQERDKIAAEKEREKAKRIVEKILSLTPLTETQREVINAFLRGLSLREIARERGVYFYAVQKAFKAAIEKMKRTAKENNIDPDDEDEIEIFEEYGF